MRHIVRSSSIHILYVTCLFCVLWILWSWTQPVDIFDGGKVSVSWCCI